MRFNINLASQPYQDFRRFAFRWGILLALLFVVTVGLVFKASNVVAAWRANRQVANEYGVQIKAVEARAAAAKAVLNLPQNRDTRDRSEFLNEVIARKAFSWTEVLEDLERTVPAGLNVLTMRTTVDADAQLELDLTVSGQSRERVIELLQNLERSKHFTSARVISERAPELAAGNRSGSPVVLFELSAVYVPAFERGGM